MCDQSGTEMIANNLDNESSSIDQLQSPPQTDDKIEKIKIVLDNPQNTYCSGQTIRGTITLNCSQKTQIRGKYKRITKHESDLCGFFLKTEVV